MNLLLGFVVGALLGVGGEQLWHRRYDQPAPGVPPGPTTARPGRQRRIVLAVLGTALVLVLIGLVGGYLYASRQFDKIEKVPVGSELSGAKASTGSTRPTTTVRPR